VVALRFFRRVVIGAFLGVVDRQGDLERGIAFVEV
jgi:hypothetical protein